MHLKVKFNNNENNDYSTKAVVYDIPDEFDCILGMPFFATMDPDINWTARVLNSVKSIDENPIGNLVEDQKKSKTSEEKSLDEAEPGGENGPVFSSEAYRAARDEYPLEAISHKPSRAAALNPEVISSNQGERFFGGKDSVKLTEDRSPIRKRGRRSKDVSVQTLTEKMFTIGIEETDGTTTKFIRSRPLKKLLRSKGNPEKDFLLVLTNDTITSINNNLDNDDEPCHVGNEKAHRYLETDWESFKDNPAYDLIRKFKDTVFKPELPDGLLMKRDIEHRVDVKDDNVAMFRQQWRLSPDQKKEIHQWVKSMVSKGLIRPSISPHAAPTFCVRKPVGWRIVHDYRLLNSNTIRQSIPMTRKEDIFDAMSGAQIFSTMDPMSAYYQVRMKEEHIKYTAFQAPNGLYEYLVLPMGLSNAPANKASIDEIIIYGSSPYKVVL